MAEAVYYLAQHDGGHETVQPHAADPAAEAHTEAPAHGGEHGQASPMRSEPNLSIYTTIAFLLVVAGLYRLAPKILAVLDERAARIADDLKGAEDAKADAEKLQAEHAQQLADARAEARHIVEEARQQADTQAREILATAQADATALKQKAQEEIEADRVRAVKDLRGEIAALSCSVASRLIAQEMTPDAHRGLIDGFIDELLADDGRRN